MALKDDIESIKNDLVGESRFLEHYIKIENHFKKHKMKFVSGIVIIVVAFSGNLIYESVQMSKKLTANSAYLAYEKDPTSTKDLQIIKEDNPALYALITLKTAVKNSDLKALEALKSSGIHIISKLASYHLALLSDDTKALEDYVLSEKAILKDFASMQLAYKFYENGKYKDAKDMLVRIPFDSQLKKSATSLEHYKLAE